MLWTVFSVAVYFTIIYFIVGRYKAGKFRGGVLLVIRLRLIWKILLLLTGLEIVAFSFIFPDFPLFVSVGVCLMIILVSASVDIFITTGGLFYGSKFLPWQEIKNISSNAFFVSIDTRRMVDRKIFLRIFWKITQADLERISAAWLKLNRPPERL